MMNSNKSLKRVLLSLAMIAAVQTITPSEPASAPVTVPLSQTIRSFAKDYKMAFVGAAAWYIIDTRLRTRSKATFSMDDLKKDFKDLLNSLNVFDVKLYEQLVFLFDKYIIGLEIKIEDTTTKTEKEDGSVVTIKGKKLVQKPFGVYGLIDAYVLKNAKKFTTETLVGAAGLYVYLTYPYMALIGQLVNSGKSFNVTVTTE
jgi:hypothetical protein